MAFLFGGGRPPRPPPDPVREHRLELQRGARAMDREDLKVFRSEGLLKAEIERHARHARYDLCQSKARELIRLRAHRARLSKIKDHMTALDRQLATVQGGTQVQAVLLNATRVMATIVFEVEGEGDATDDAMAAVFAELGLDQHVPSHPRAEPLRPVSDAEMEARLARLRAA
jgi:hypothetical protein